MKQINIMFVCHGNICRSPMAEIIFNDIIKRKKITGVGVASSATSTEEIWNGVGNPIYPPARRELLSRGYDVPNHRAVQLRREDYGKYDLFIGMDGRNITNMYRIFGSDPEGKVRRLLDFAGGGDVADPWYSGDFATTYRDILRGCEALFNFLFEK